MLRLFRGVGFIALAFWAGVQFERAGAQETCASEAEWVPYLQCVAAEITSESIR
ncbi:MAG: hypothetical protein AAF647_10755 [Pseudomonadota bacterium]